MAPHWHNYYTVPNWTMLLVGYGWHSNTLSPHPALFIIATVNVPSTGNQVRHSAQLSPNQVPGDAGCLSKRSCFVDDMPIILLSLRLNSLKQLLSCFSWICSKRSVSGFWCFLMVFLFMLAIEIGASDRYSINSHLCFFIWGDITPRCYIVLVQVIDSV